MPMSKNADSSDRHMKRTKIVVFCFTAAIFIAVVVFTLIGEICRTGY